MSALVRFEDGLVKYKARIFEQGSYRRECAVCGEKRFGVLLRFLEPGKYEKTICHQCLVTLCHATFSKPTPQEYRQEEASKRVVKKRKKRTVKKTAKRSLTSKKVQDNGNAEEEETGRPIGDGTRNSDEQNQVL